MKIFLFVTLLAFSYLISYATAADCLEINVISCKVNGKNCNNDIQNEDLPDDVVLIVEVINPSTTQTIFALIEIPDDSFPGWQASLDPFKFMLEPKRDSVQHTIRLNDYNVNQPDEVLIEASGINTRTNRDCNGSAIYQLRQLKCLELYVKSCKVNGKDCNNDIQVEDLPNDVVLVVDVVNPSDTDTMLSPSVSLIGIHPEWTVTFVDQLPHDLAPKSDFMRYVFTLNAYDVTDPDRVTIIAVSTNSNTRRNCAGTVTYLLRQPKCMKINVISCKVNGKDCNNDIQDEDLPNDVVLVVEVINPSDTETILIPTVTADDFPPDWEPTIIPPIHDLLPKRDFMRYTLTLKAYDDSKPDKVTIKAIGAVGTTIITSKYDCIRSYTYQLRQPKPKCHRRLQSGPTLCTQRPTTLPSAPPSPVPTFEPTAAPTPSPTFVPGGGGGGGGGDGDGGNGGGNGGNGGNGSGGGGGGNTTLSPSVSPTIQPSRSPTASPSRSPTVSPTRSPTASPTRSPTASPSRSPTASPTRFPTANPTPTPTKQPTPSPTVKPTPFPTNPPTRSPSRLPNINISLPPFIVPDDDDKVVGDDTVKKDCGHKKKPTRMPTKSPTTKPTRRPYSPPTNKPKAKPTKKPVPRPSLKPVSVYSIP